MLPIQGKHLVLTWRYLNIQPITHIYPYPSVRIMYIMLNLVLDNYYCFQAVVLFPFQNWNALIAKLEFCRVTLLFNSTLFERAVVTITSQLWNAM
jgi:hypothetical protein